MRQFLVFCIILTIFLFSCKEPTDRIEIDLHECLMSSISLNETHTLKKALKGYENHLISKGILKSSQSISYFHMYRKIASGNSINLKNDFNFSNKIDFLSKENNQEIMDCLEDLYDTKRYLNSKVYKIEKGLEDLQERGVLLTSQVIAQNIVSVISPDDFELDYYKLNTIMFIENHNKNSY